MGTVTIESPMGFIVIDGFSGGTLHLIARVDVATPDSSLVLPGSYPIPAVIVLMLILNIVYMTMASDVGKCSSALPHREMNLVVDSAVEQGCVVAQALLHVVDHEPLPHILIHRILLAEPNVWDKKLVLPLDRSDGCPTLDVLVQGPALDLANIACWFPLFANLHDVVYLGLLGFVPG